MSIKEVETLTGITKQNIRFYEKKGLLHPQRNEENSYREYTEADVETLKLIKVLRRLDISLEDIHSILLGEPIAEVLQKQLNLLLEKKSGLDAAITMCRFLLDTKSDVIDTEAALQKMDDMESKGGRFMKILNDYKKVSKAEAKRQFIFSPDSMALNPQDFAEELRKYGEKNNLNLTITKGGMYPKFEIDGIEYEASRTFGRYGAVIECKMTHPELLREEYKEIPSERSGIYRKIHWAIFYFAVPVVMFLYFVLVSKSILLGALMEIVYASMLWFTYRNFRIKP